MGLAQEAREPVPREPPVEIIERRDLDEVPDVRAKARRELGRDAARRGAEVGLLSFDLDGFKPVNDSFGHQAGDEVLVELAQAVGRIVRRNEMFCRVGGDEFVLLVPGSSAEGLPSSRIAWSRRLQR